MALAIFLILIGGGVCVGWSRRTRPARFAYRRLDVEMDALRRCMTCPDTGIPAE